MEARRVAFAEREIEINQRAVKRVCQSVLDVATELGGAALTRHHDHRDDVAVAQVGRDEEPHRGFALDVEDEAQLRAQLGHRRAKEFVLGEAVEGRHDFLVVVRAGHGALRVKHLAQLRAQNGNVLRFLGVGLGREQADEIVERGDAAECVGAANRDAVHRAAAMDVRLGARLADHQRRPLEEELAARRREFLERDRGAKARFVMLAHDAELGAGVECEPGGAVVAVHQVAAKAEKDEAALDEPSQEVADLDQFAVGRGFLADLQRAAGHLIEVVGGLVDFG